MDKNILINNISQLGYETLECVKMIEKYGELFLFDTETHEDLQQFLRIMKIKALRISNPRDRKDITKNIRRKEVYEKWQTTNLFNDFCNNQQVIQCPSINEE